MSDKKPGFFKRLLGNLLGGKKEESPAEETAVEEAPRVEAGPELVKKGPAKKKTPAKKAPPKAKDKPAPRPAAKPREKTKAAAKTETRAEPVKKPAPKKPAAKKPVPKKPARRKTEENPVAQIMPAEETPQEEAPEKKSFLGRVLPFGRTREEEPAPPEPETPTAPEPVHETEPEAGGGEKKGWFSRLRDGLSRTSDALTENITTIFNRRRLDDETLQELEDALIQADLGIDMAVQITEEVARGRYNKEIAPEEVRAVLGAEVASVLEPMATPLVVDDTHKPYVVLVVGVNGTGKTTTIGKLAHQFAHEGKNVVMAAGDTFRAAAIDQLKIWGERTGSPVIARDVGTDAAGLVYDAMEQASGLGADVLLIDTAGRLQNKSDLMEELAKIVRVIKKLDESAPHSVLLVLDATTGQNAVRQVEVFQEIAGVTGLIMTKLDGTARGGILVAIARQFALPIHAIGVGETIDDLQPFDAYEFAALIAGAHEKIEGEA